MSSQIVRERADILQLLRRPSNGDEHGTRTQNVRWGAQKCLQCLLGLDRSLEGSAGVRWGANKTYQPRHIDRTWWMMEAEGESCTRILCHSYAFHHHPVPHIRLRVPRCCPEVHSIVEICIVVVARQLYGRYVCTATAGDRPRRAKSVSAHGRYSDIPRVLDDM